MTPLNRHLMIASMPRHGTKLLQDLLDGPKMLGEYFNVRHTYLDDNDTLQVLPFDRRVSFDMYSADSRASYYMQTREHRAAYRRHRGESSSVKVWLSDIQPLNIPGKDEVYVIRLRRSDVFSAFLSMMIARQTNQYNLPVQTELVESFYIQDLDYYAYKHSVVAGETIANEYLRDYQSQIVYYEDLLANTVPFIHGIRIKFVHESKILNQHSHRLHSKVINLGDVYDWFHKDYQTWQRFGYLTRGWTL